MSRILITGASRGLGKELAICLSESNSVIGCARTNLTEEELQLIDYSYIGGVDLSNSNTWHNIEKELFDCDVLINNAAIAFDGLLATQGEESIEQVIQTNLISTLKLTKRYIRARLSKHQPGCIINISSIIANRGYAGLSVYAASKAGLDGATRALAREMGPKGFRVNSVLPGYMETDMSASLSEDKKNQIVRRTPLGRLATVDDIVPVIEFLISPGASFITGQSIVIDGGITV